MIRSISIALLCVLAIASGARAGVPETPAEAAERLYDLGMSAMEANDFGGAAARFDEASALVDDPILVWNAARAHHKAGHHALAKERYLKCLARPDFPADKREQIAKYLIDIDRVEHPPDAPGPGPTDPPRPTESPTRIAPWIVMGSGLLIAAGGAVLHFVAEGERSDVRDAVKGGFVTSMTQVEAKDLEGEANTLDTIGAIGISVGGAVIVAGVIWLVAGGDGATEPETKGSVHVGIGDRSVVVFGRF